MIAVDYVVRGDAGVKGGGDLRQVEEYVERLDDVDARMVSFSSDMRLRDRAIVHYINVDRPYEFLHTVRRAGARPLVVSPVHHSAVRVQMMRRAEAGRGVRSLADRILPELARELLASQVRNQRANAPTNDLMAQASFGLASVVSAPRLWRKVGKALDAAAAVMLLAPGEAADLASDFGWAGRNGVLAPNGMPERAGRASKPWSGRSSAPLVVGRIEPRKRSLELALAADEARVPVVFIGPLNGADTRYARSFVALASRSAYVEYRGALDHADVLSALSSARVLLNASWVEVQSLVDLEAVAQGCSVVSFPNGNSRDWLPRSVAYTSTFELRELLELAVRKASSDGSPVTDECLSWSATVDRLREVYEPLGARYRDG